MSTILCHNIRIFAAGVHHNLSSHDDHDCFVR